MTEHCPTCGQPIVDLPKNMPRLTRVQLTIFNMLRRAGDSGLTADLIEDRVYRNHPHIDGHIRTHMFNLRKQLKGTGLHIDSHGWGRREGYRATYRLVEDEHEQR